MSYNLVSCTKVTVWYKEGAIGQAMCLIFKYFTEGTTEANQFRITKVNTGFMYVLKLHAAIQQICFRNEMQIYVLRLPVDSF